MKMTVAFVLEDAVYNSGMMIFCIHSVELQIGAIIVTPTRELAVQIDEVLSHFLCHVDNKFTHMLFIGGNNPATDVDRFLQHGFVHSL